MMTIHATNEWHMRRRAFREAAIALAFLSWCVVLIAARVFRTGSIYYTFLVWNLFLASIPFGVSYLLTYRLLKRRHVLALLPLWLIFFPNAPYLMTDLLHLRPKDGAPVWYDLMLLLTAAGAGIYLAYVSLRHVQRIVQGACGTVVGWCFAVIILFLSAFGVYLGRFQRWNSWDVIASPFALVHSILDRFVSPLDHPRTWIVTIGFGVLMTLGYVAAAVTANGETHS